MHFPLIHNSWNTEIIYFFNHCTALNHLDFYLKSWFRSGFFSASGQNSSYSELYIEKAPLHIGVILHQIKKYIEVASICPYLEQKTTTAWKLIPHRSRIEILTLDSTILIFQIFISIAFIIHWFFKTNASQIFHLNNLVFPSWTERICLFDQITFHWTAEICLLKLSFFK